MINVVRQELHAKDKDIRGHGISLPYSPRRGEAVSLGSIYEDSNIRSGDATHNEFGNFRRELKVEKSSINKRPFKTIKRFFEINFEHNVTFFTLALVKAS